MWAAIGVEGRCPLGPTTAPTLLFTYASLCFSPGLPDVIFRSEEPLFNHILLCFQSYRFNSKIEHVVSLLQWVEWRVCERVCSAAQSCLFATYRLEPTRLLCPWDFPGKNTGVGCHFLLQKIFLTQGSNSCLLCLLHCRQLSLPLSHGASPN